MMRGFFCLACLIATALYSEDLSDADQYFIKQDEKYRMFHIHTEEKLIASAVSSGWGIFEFYNPSNEKTLVNQDDVLYDLDGRMLGVTSFAYETEGFFERERFFHSSSRIDLLSPKGDLLAVFDEEGERENRGTGCFVFRDPKTQNPLAMAFWTWTPPKRWYHDCITVHEKRHQEWSLIIMDREHLKESKISNSLLVWTLLKHSQRHLLGPRDLPYEQGFTH